MSELIHVRTELDIPGGPSAIHIAEMEAIDDTTNCRILRIIELSADSGDVEGEVITGAGRLPGRTFGLSAEPNIEVPHPDSYEDFPDITATRLPSAEFEGLWQEASAKFPEL